MANVYIEDKKLENICYKCKKDAIEGKVKVTLCRRLLASAPECSDLREMLKERAQAHSVFPDPIMKTKGTVSDSSYPRRDAINRGNQKQIGWRWTQTRV